jgi:hypothetical protein
VNCFRSGWTGLRAGADSGDYQCGSPGLVLQVHPVHRPRQVGRLPIGVYADLDAMLSVLQRTFRSVGQLVDAIDNYITNCENVTVEPKKTTTAASRRSAPCAVEAMIGKQAAYLYPRFRRRFGCTIGRASVRVA